MSPRMDLTGQTFDKWTVLNYDHRDTIGSLYWLCRCECGTIKSVTAGNLRSGKSPQCWECRKKESIESPYALKHGMSRTSIYNRYNCMLSRCYNMDNIAYKNYGGRGITVCERWKNSFENFYADMGDVPDGLTLDRINNNGNYEPSNCRWTSGHVQSENRRNVKHDEFDKLKGKVSRQRIWQLRKRKENKCTICGQPVNMSVAYCDKHFILHFQNKSTKNPFRYLKNYPENRDKTVSMLNTVGISAKSQV